MLNKVLLICLIAFSLCLVLDNDQVFAQGLCEDCDGTCDAGYECKGDPTPGDGNAEGKCHKECPPGQTCIENPLSACSFEDLVGSITDFIFYIALALLPLMVLIGSFYIMSAGEDPKRVDTGRKVILYAVIGFTIIFFARGIVAIIKHVLKN